MSKADRLLVGVETTYGSGDYHMDERLLVEEVTQHGDAIISTARLSVLLDDAFDAEEARRRYRPERRVRVMTAEANPRARQILFEGYPPVQTTGWEGRISGNGEEESFVFEAEHVLARMSQDPSSFIYGRRVRTGAMEDGLVQAPGLFVGRSATATALPCIFNPDGVGNRAPVPMAVRGSNGTTRLIPLFTWDGGAAEPWTFGDVLRYLIWFYLPRGGPVFEGGMFEATDHAAAGSPESGRALGKALRRVPVSLVCEAMSLLEALKLWADAAGVQITTETVNQDGRVETRLRLWDKADGPVRSLHLARGGRADDGSPRYSTANKSTAQILTDNNTHRGRATWDYGEAANTPVVLGDIKRFEVTLPLKPGWLPRDSVDNVPAEARAFHKAQALTPEQVATLGKEAGSSPWFRRHHRGGAEFHQYGDVARLWVLNEDGALVPGLYNRHAPFDDYRPFDFATVLDPTMARPGGWMRRPRRLLPAISLSADGRSLGVCVDLSFDSGTSWYRQSGGIRVLDDRAGVYLECENPCEIAPPGFDPAVTNLWYALIDRTLRVRVTAVIESDERLVGTRTMARSRPPVRGANGWIVRRSREYGYESRRHTQNVLLTSGTRAHERDDTAAIAAFADELALAGAACRVHAAPVIPWLECGYELGDRIDQVRGRHLSFALTNAAPADYPVITGRSFVLRDGCYETRLTLG